MQVFTNKCEPMKVLDIAASSQIITVVFKYNDEAKQQNVRTTHQGTNSA